MTTQSLDLNLIPKGISPRLYVSQYDKGQTWTFNIYAGNTAYTIPNGATVTIQGTKPDKTGFQYSCTASGNVVTATEQQQMTVIAGEVPAEIRITNNNEIIATLNFILVVEPAALTDETEISETDLPIIEQAIEMFPHYQEMIDEVSSDIQTLSNKLDDEVVTRATLGAKNLLDCSLETLKKINQGSGWNGNSWTAYGVEITVNNDNSITISRVSTSSSDVWFNLTATGDMPEGNYTLSGCPVGGGSSTYAMVTRNSDNQLVYVDENGYTGRFPLSTAKITLYVRGGSNPSSPVTFYPMLRLATDSDQTYQPYAMTNRELTDAKANKSDLASISITGTTNNTGRTIASGTCFYLNGTLVRAIVDIDSNATLTQNTNYKVVTAGALNEPIVFYNRGNVSSSSLENYTQAGIFQVYATDVLTEGWGILIVTTNNAVVTQTLINGVGIAFRTYKNSNWSTWTKTLFS